ncbi:MAG: hypothetical protein ACHQ51_11860 [Elusimicrobiota bacterium]
MRSAAIAVLAVWCAAAAAAAGQVVVSIPDVPMPVAAPPAALQLRADLIALSVPTTMALPPAAVPLSPAAWSSVQAVLAPAPADPAAVLPHAATPAAPAAVKEQRAAALARLEVAGQVLGGMKPGEFAALPEAAQREALDKLWDGWRSRGLVSEPAEKTGGDAGRRLDALILEGVDDKSLTFANKSIFLGVGVLGYPLEDAVWLSRTRIRDALDENNLRYPEGQRWMTDDGTPEFLGQSAGAQKLVDDWGAATTLGAQIVRQVEAGSKDLPKSSVATPAAAAAFADIAADLAKAGDKEALEYLSGRDPTFSAFLLDVRKPGYYLYNGDKGAVARILATPAARRLGLRRVEHGDEGSVVPSSYIYRSARVAERLREASRETDTNDTADIRRRLQAYAERAAPLAEPGPSAGASAYKFVEAEFLPGSALDSAANVMPAQAGGAAGRSDIPLPLSVIRQRLASGERHPLVEEARWNALALILRGNPELAAVPGAKQLRLVAQPYQTRGKRVARMTDGSAAMIQLSALDELARMKPGSDQQTRELRFLSAALQAALR